MKWPWTKYHEERDPFDGADARKEATAHLAQDKSRWPEVKRVSQSLRQLRERNHFAEQVILIFGGDDNRDD